MRKLLSLLLTTTLLAGISPATEIRADETVDLAADHSGGASLTIYNSDFAVVRERLPLDLHSGVNSMRYAGATAHVEPDSVILRDPSGRTNLQIVEQGYRNDPISQQLLLSFYEGKTIEFEVGQGKIISGKVIRSGYNGGGAFTPQGYYQPAPGTEPLIEVDGKLQFGLPGRPIFPALGADTILKPAFTWRLRADHPGPMNAQLSYLTSGMNWQADYNLVASPTGDSIDLVGWVTFRNNSGRSFDNTHVRLMAGDVNKIKQEFGGRYAYKMANMEAADAAAPVVSEKAFDEFHLYTLNDPVTLRDGESKQVQFVSATGVKSQRLYVYDGAQLAMYGYNYGEDAMRTSPEYGTQSNKKVWVMQEFKNSAANHLGMPLPKGKLRFYGENKEEGDLEFTGENVIEHTPADETVRAYTGNAFDIVGERRRTDFHTAPHVADEGFEIKLRNHKKTAVEVRVVEHLYRWSNWEITAKNYEYRKIDSRTIEYRVALPPDSEKVVNYSVHYSW